jgi:hypothetical protein
MALGSGDGHQSNAGELPVCRNRVINEVVKRAGCTVGDTRCWNRGGGFCMDYVERRTAGKGSAAPARRVEVKGEEVRSGDVAVFRSRAHYAFVERVIKGEDGRPVAVDLSEFNFGTCWVDEDAMITDQYKLLNRRLGVPLRDVDGGFLRADPGGR